MTYTKKNHNALETHIGPAPFRSSKPRASVTLQRRNGLWDCHTLRRTVRQPYPVPWQGVKPESGHKTAASARPSARHRNVALRAGLRTHEAVRPLTTAASTGTLTSSEEQAEGVWVRDAEGMFGPQQHRVYELHHEQLQNYSPSLAYLILLGR